MNCHAFLNVLDLYTEGRLAPRRAMKAAEHLASCASCRAKAAPASAAAPSGAKAPSDLKARLLAAAKAVPSAPVPAPAAAPQSLALWPREARGIALAAVLLLAAAALVSSLGAPSQSAGGNVAAVEVP